MLRYGVAFFLSCCGQLGVNSLDVHSVVHSHQSGQKDHEIFLEFKPEQDLVMLLPYLQKGDKASFKHGLGVMVQNGGNERIQRSLQGLSAMGFDATEIQNWLQQESVPIPQSKLANSRLEPRQSTESAKATVAMAEEKQLAERKQQEQKAKEQKAKAKEALTKELAQRLSKGMQAFKRVEAIETSEAALKQQLADNNQRLGWLEKALEREETQREEVANENLRLKEELQREEKLNRETLDRVETLEKAEKGHNQTDRVAVLEEETVQFRAALAGAARRLITLEADVASQRQFASPALKVVRHQKQPMQPAAT